MFQFGSTSPVVSSFRPRGFNSESDFFPPLEFVGSLCGHACERSRCKHMALGWSFGLTPRLRRVLGDALISHLCACGVRSHSAAGLMVWAVHLPGPPGADRHLPARELKSTASHLQHSQMTEAIGNLFAVSLSCQSWLTFGAVMEWVLRVLSLKSRLPSR